MPDVLLKRLKVYAYPDGRIVPYGDRAREGALAPIDDSWWLDVLHDPRARPPRAASIEATSYNAPYRLDRQRQTAIYFACRLCGWTHLQYKSDLIKAHGPAANVVQLAKDLAGCDRRNGGPCGAHCVR